MIYKIKTTYIVEQYWSVSALTEEEALDKVLDGNGFLEKEVTNDYDSNVEVIGYDE